MSVWVPHTNGWLRQSPSSASGVVDYIYNSLTKHIKDNNLSDWAYESFIFCEDLLLNGYRWPEEFGDYYGGRKRTDLTWDPFVGYAACARFMGLGIKAKPPWTLWPPTYWIWWKKLKKDNRQQFVRWLSYWQKYADNLNFEIKYQDNFYL